MRGALAVLVGHAVGDVGRHNCFCGCEVVVVVKELLDAKRESLS